MKIILNDISIDLNEERLQPITESIHQVICIAKKNLSQFYYVSPTFEKIFNKSPQSLMDNPNSWIEFIHPEDLERIQSIFKTNFAKRVYTLDFRVLREDGIISWMFARFIELGKKDKERYTVIIIEDVSERRKSQKVIDYLAHHDYLTGLPNRMLFNKKLRQEIEEAEKEKTNVAIIFIDLDHFKDINNALGHQIGDELLQVIAQEISFLLTKEETIARLGGDEFVIFYKNPKSKNDIIAIVLEILNILVEPFFIGVHKLYTSASIGISIYPDDGNDVTTLMKNAELAMYNSKAYGRNHYKFFVQGMSEVIHEKLLIEQFLRNAIENNEFSIQYQPQINMLDNSLIGSEALIRWNNSQLGTVPPIKFIPIAEENGMIFPIGEWMLKTVCNQMKEWEKSKFLVPRIFVNLSVKQLEQGNLLEFIKYIFKEKDIDVSNLGLEITESIIMHKTQYNVSVLDGLKNLGIELSIDDFGTGYSNLKYLTRLPVSKLKIDQSFVRDIGRDPSDETIIITIIALAKNLGLSVIAEGVETLEHKDFLLKHGCNDAQGFLFSKSLPPEEFFKKYYIENS